MSRADPFPLLKQELCLDEGGGSTQILTDRQNANALTSSSYHQFLKISGHCNIPNGNQRTDPRVWPVFISKPFVGKHLVKLLIFFAIWEIFTQGGKEAPLPPGNLLTNAKFLLR